MYFHYIVQHSTIWHQTDYKEQFGHHSQQPCRHLYKSPTLLFYKGSHNKIKTGKELLPFPRSHFLVSTKRMGSYFCKFDNMASDTSLNTDYLKHWNMVCFSEFWVRFCCKLVMQTTRRQTDVQKHINMPFDPRNFTTSQMQGTKFRFLK